MTRTPDDDAGSAPDSQPGGASTTETFVRDGQQAFDAQDFATARRIYESWVRADPGNPRAWNNLGVSLKALGLFEAAVESYRRAIALAPDRVLAWSNLGSALTQLGRLDEALASLATAARLDPRDAAIRHNLSCAYYSAGRFDEARAAIDRAIALEPGNEFYLFERGVLDLRVGDYAAGWRGFEYRWLHGMARQRAHALPLWDGSALNGRRLLILAEQGFGDNILAARFLPQVRASGARVILETRPELQRLFENLAGVDELRIEPARENDCDLYCPIMTLPARCGTTLETIPPPAILQVSAAARQAAGRVLEPHAGRFRIGVVWSGSVTFPGNHQRACGLRPFLELDAIPGVQLFSLQLGPARSELGAIGAADRVVDLAAHLGDFADTAAYVEQLDLVVMTDSSVAHLAGSLRRPVWNLLGFAPYWLYGMAGGQTPWYPTMRLFRQQTAFAWGEVFAVVLRELRIEVAKSGKSQ